MTRDPQEHPLDLPREARWTHRLPRVRRQHLLRRGLATAIVLTVATAASPGLASAYSAPSSTHRSAQAAALARPVAYSAPFRVATFNVLGASHTEASRTFETYEKRLPKAISLINGRQFSVVGFQELEQEQFRLFKEQTGKTWGFYPGFHHGTERWVRNSVAWRRDVWERVERHTYEVPYFHGNLNKNPYVLLRNKQTGAEVWFMNTHNPANSHGDASAWRRESLDIQGALATRLEATGHPVVFTGDFNGREVAFCQLTRVSALKAVNGGSQGDDGCDPPKRMRIDWIFTSRSLRPIRTLSLDGPLIDTITDHGIIASDIAVPLD